MEIIVKNVVLRRWSVVSFFIHLRSNLKYVKLQVSVGEVGSSNELECTTQYTNMSSNVRYQYGKFCHNLYCIRTPWTTDSPLVVQEFASWTSFMSSHFVSVKSVLRLHLHTRMAVRSDLCPWDFLPPKYSRSRQRDVWSIVWRYHKHTNKFCVKFYFKYSVGTKFRGICLPNLTASKSSLVEIEFVICKTARVH
jgi:hypothetical protein